MNTTTMSTATSFWARVDRGHRAGALIPVAAALALVSGGGCAFGTRHVYLDYSDSLSEPKSGTATPSTAFVLGEFVSRCQTDRNGDPIIGCVRNGYGWETARVVAKRDPSLWLSEAIAAELQNTGCRRAVDAHQDPEALQIEGELTHLYVDLYAENPARVSRIVEACMRLHVALYVRNRAHVSLIVRIKRGDQTIYADAFNGSAQPLAWFATADEYRKACNAALQSALNVAVPKLAAALEQSSVRAVSARTD